MESEFLGAAVTLTETIREAHRRHHFEAAVRDFVRMLASVPDYPANDFSEDGIGALKVLAEEVIERIERRLSDDNDPGSDRQELAGAVYEIRRLLEEINRWRQHYLGAR